MWIGGNEVFRAAMNVGEVAAAAAGDQNLFSDSVRVVQQGNPLAVFSGLDGAHQASRTCAENDDIKNLGHFVRPRRRTSPLCLGHIFVGAIGGD